MDRNLFSYHPITEPLYYSERLASMVVCLFFTAVFHYPIPLRQLILHGRYDGIFLVHNCDANFDYLTKLPTIVPVREE